MTLVVAADPEKTLTDYLHGLLGTVAELSGYSVGTTVQPGTTPSKAIRVQLTGGSDEGRTHSRPILDIRVWADGTQKTEADAKEVARILHGMIRRDFRARTFNSPVPLPDPADPTKTLVLFSVELLRAGVQS